MSQESFSLNNKMPKFNLAKEKKTINQLLKEYVFKKAVELDTDVTNRKSGVTGQTGTTKRQAGYDTLRDFFDGDQWQHVPEEGGTMKVYNYVATTVLNYTAFLTNEAPEFDVPPMEITDPIEVDRSERKEIILKKVLDDNIFSLLFENAVQGGSLLGDSFIVGPFWDSQNKKIKIHYVRRPETVRPIFSSDDYQTITGYIRDYYMAREKAEEIFEEDLKKKNITLSEQQISYEHGSASTDNTSQNMVHIREYWDDVYAVTYVGDKELSFTEHNWGFVPIIYVSNVPHPTRWNGISDVENILDPQVEYNENKSNLSDIVNEEAHPKLFGKNLMPVTVQGGVMQVIDMGDDAEMIPDPRHSTTQPLDTVVEKGRRDIFDASGQNEILYGGAGVQEATGRALSVLMQSVNNRVKGRQGRWRVALQILCRNIFLLLEKYVPESRPLINNYYEVDVFFPGTLMRNVTDEINKFARKLQSRYTTMKNLGVPSPKDEESLMKKEFIDDTMLQAEGQKIMAQAIAEVQQQQPEQQGMGGGPMLQEGENQEPQPAAVEGVAEQSSVSSEGALAQNIQRKTGVPMVKRRK